MESDCCPSSERLFAFVLGKLPEPEAVQLAEHASTCPRCKAKLNITDQQTDKLIVQLRQTPLPDTLQSEPALLRRLPQIETLLMCGKETDLPSQAMALEEITAYPLNPPGHSDRDLTSFLAPPESSDELGRLGGYRALKVLGHGGMGVVFQAHDPKADRQVALKVMLPGVAQKPQARERFLREARATAKIENDYIVPLYQVSEDNGVPFLVMPLLKGMTLEEWLRQREKDRQPVPLAEVLRLGTEIAQGLAAAHECGLIHRDIKPANLWLDASSGNRVKILDFGLVRPADDASLTQPGTVVGTAPYMAPEQALSQSMDHRADLYSLGCVLYRLCTGRLPFIGNDALSILVAATTEEARPVAKLNPHVPPPLAALVMQLLAKRPEGRPASARLVIDALRAVGGEPTSLVAEHLPASGNRASRRLGRLAAAVMGLGAALGLLPLLFSRPGVAPPKTVGDSAVAATQPNTAAPAGLLPHAEFVHMAAQLPGLPQIEAVNERLKMLNAGFEGIGPFREGFWMHAGQPGRIRMVEFSSDRVKDISPLAAATDLKRLKCPGSKPGLGQVVDLRPLKDLKLIELDISCTNVEDLSPLRGMSESLKQLNCRDTHVRSLTPLKHLRVLASLVCDPPTTPRDLEILSVLPNLKTINGQWKLNFLKTAKLAVPKSTSP